MAYHWTDTIVGLTPVTTVDTEQKFPIGTLAKAYDSAYGEGTFIYLPGVASVVAGDVVAYDTDAGTTTRAVAATRGPVAVAMAAVVAATYGWFQVRGAAVVSCAGAVVAGTPAYLTATAGEVDDAVTAGSLVDGMVFKTADGTPAAGFAIAQIAFPSASGAA
jgi:hypothetical protein